MRLAQSLQISATAALVGVVPFIGVMAADILPHEGHYIHFSKVEALTLLLVLASILWLMHVTLLTVAQWLTQRRPWTFGFVALPAIAAVATVFFEGWWRELLQPPIWNGGGYWIVVTGGLATAAATWLSSRRSACYPSSAPSSNSPNTIVEA